MAEVKLYCVGLLGLFVSLNSIQMISGITPSLMDNKLSTVAQTFRAGSSKETTVNSCKRVKCQKPPSTSNCTIVNKNDKSVPRPKGGKAECCPLWKCRDSDKSSNYFTFHGIVGEGSETVTYTESTKSKKSDVTSISTGSHGANARAGDVSDDLSDVYMKEMAKSFQQYGIKI